MTQTAAKPQRETIAHPVDDEILLNKAHLADLRKRQADFLRLLWEHRRVFLRTGGIALLTSALFAFLIPKSYTSTTQLMPPDSQSTSGLAMMAAMASRGGGGLAGMAGDLLGLKSETAQDHLIQQFELQKIYRQRLLMDARKLLDENTVITEDRKSGIIMISVTDHNAQRAAAMASAYVDELNSLVAELSTSAARRERVFLEERLKVAKQDLDDAVNALAQFSSKNNTLDIQNEGRAMLETAGALAGEFIAAQSQLEGLRQIYTDNNPRVRSLNARVSELRKQLEKLGGTQANAANGIVPAPGQSADAPSGKASSMPFPSIRNLPLLGAKYADYYRRVKIQETVFELLTEQYELAKVQEAKEIPSVKVLDPGRVPEKKSSPSRLLITLSGTLFAIGCSVVWILGTNNWEKADPLDPRKILAQEVFATVKASAPWGSQNGHGGIQGFWSRFGSREPRTNGVVKNQKPL